MAIKRMVMDVLVPHEPQVLDFAEKLSALEQVDGVTIQVLEIDEMTKSIEITIEGQALVYDDIRRVIEELGGSIHSIDRVSAGMRIVEPDVRGVTEA